MQVGRSEHYVGLALAFSVDQASESGAVAEDYGGLLASLELVVPGLELPLAVIVAR